MKVVQVDQWLEGNKKFFLPPVCNKLMHDSQLKVFFVGGPNVRSDYHMEEGEELFYMVKGDMLLKVIENGNPRDIIIKEGEIFLLPAKVQHSPQRYANTIGLVIERERIKTEVDSLRYFVKDSTEILFERWFYCQDLGKELEPVIKEFFNSKEYQTGRPTKESVLETPPYQPDSSVLIEKPFSLFDWINKHEVEIRKNGKKDLFTKNYQSKISVFGEQKRQRVVNQDYETFIWQLKSESTVEIGSQRFTLPEGSTILLPKRSECLLTNFFGFTLVVSMPPKSIQQ